MLVKDQEDHKANRKEAIQRDLDMQVQLNALNRQMNEECGQGEEVEG